MALFQKGVSGNPGGRPKIKVDMRERVRVHAGAAIDTLLAVMNDDKAPAAARVSAAIAILDRGYGRPAQAVHQHVTRHIEELSAGLLILTEDAPFAIHQGWNFTSGYTALLSERRQLISTIDNASRGGPVIIQLKSKHLVANGFLFYCLSITACVHPVTRLEPGAIEPADELAIIDAHTHTNFTGSEERTSHILKTEEQYFKEWRDAGVVGAVSHTSASNDDFYDLRHRNVIHCAGVGRKIDVRGIESGLRSGKYGCIKIYLGYVHRFAFDREYDIIYQMAEKYDIPVVFHTGDTYSSRAKLKYADPLTIDEVAVDHPKVTLVIAHCGNPWIESAAEVTYKNPNVYMECSALFLGDLSKIPQETVDTYVIRPIAWIFSYVEDPNKLMFGSDWPLTAMKPYIEAYKRAIPQQYWKAVFHDNAVRVFKFPEHLE